MTFLIYLYIILTFLLLFVISSLIILQKRRRELEAWYDTIQYKQQLARRFRGQKPINPNRTALKRTIRGIP